MTNKELKALMSHIAGLPRDQLDRIQRLVDSLSPTLKGDEASLSGSLSDEDARSMTAAIEEAFEQAEADAAPSGQ